MWKMLYFWKNDNKQAQPTMKRLIASIAVLLTIAIYLISCEKDDLCADGTPTTPGMVVEFYKAGNSVVNPVTNFVIYEQGSAKRDTLPPGTTKWAFPLRTDADEVTWALEYNSIASNNDTIKNTDLFTIRYTRTQTYVSRACGYKTTFTLLPATQGQPNPSVEDTVPADGAFIEGDPIVVTPNIENENEVHVQIYF